jgi:glyoxylase-like metal-dependent hydrolase (beta-lactamase superfamily II)
MKRAGSIFLAAASSVLFAGVVCSQSKMNLDECDQYVRVERLGERVVSVRFGVTIFETITAIATQKGIVIIDAGMNPPITEKYRKIIAKELNRKDFAYVINTHAHMDHVFGDRVFPEARVVGHEMLTRELISTWGSNGKKPTFEEYVKQWKSELEKTDKNSDQGQQLRILILRVELMNLDQKSGFVLPLPVITFNDRMTLEMGDVTFNMIYFGQAHTESDILIYVPEERILFVGDLFDASGNLTFNDVSKEHVDKWYRTLEHLCDPANEIEYVVCGHSQRAMKKEVLGKFISQVKIIKDSYDSGKELYDVSLLNQLEERSGLQGLRAELSRVLAEKKYFFVERKLTNIVNAFLNRNKIQEAIETCTLMVNLFPASWNAYDRLADAYLRAGNKELAIENYERSLRLNPDNSDTVEQLKKLK